MMNCDCLFSPDQAVMIRWEKAPDGSRTPICCKCGGVVSDNSWSGTNRITGALQDPAAPFDHDMEYVRVDLFGSAALSCSMCSHLIFWQGTPERLEQFCANVLESKIVVCAKCRGVQEIAPEWEVMLR